MKIQTLIYHSLFLAMARVHSATIKEDTEDDESSDSNYEEHSESSDSEEVEEEVHPARVTRCNKGYQCKMNRKCVGNCIYKVYHSSSIILLSKYLLLLNRRQIWTYQLKL